MCDHGFWQHLPILCMHLELLAVAIADSKTIKICKQAGAHSTDSTFLNKTVDCPIHVYFFDFGSRQQCIVAKGKLGIEMGSCAQSAALGWSLEDGKLMRKSTMCVARLADDKASLVKCQETHEHISMDVPATYTQEELEELLRNQDKLTPEQRRTLQQQLRSAVRR